MADRPWQPSAIPTAPPTCGVLIERFAVVDEDQGNPAGDGGSDRGAGGRMSAKRSQPSVIACTIRRFSLLVILAWIALTLILTFAVPPLERVGQQHSVSMSPKDASSVQAMVRMGKDFKESDSDSFTMIVLEGQQPLGEDAHEYYAQLVRELRADPKHVEHVQDLWGIASQPQARRAPTARPRMCN